jgi:hypothetical protein
MGSKLKKTQQGRKEQYERRLANRLSLLSEKKIEPSKIEKDPLVKNLRANIAASDARLKAIAKIEQRTAELAKIRQRQGQRQRQGEGAEEGPCGRQGKEGKEGKEEGRQTGISEECCTGCKEMIRPFSPGGRPFC